jgi:hypothetical protein
MASDKLRQTVQDAMDAKQDVQKVFFGYLGNADGTVIVPGKPNYVYVTLSDGMCAQAYNTVVPSIAHLPVVCGYDIKQKRSDLFRILDIRNVPRNGTTESAFYVDKHHTSHEWLNGDIGGGTDLVYVQLRQFMPLRPSPVSPYSINIGRDIQWINGSWQVVGAQTFDLSTYIPAATSGSGSIANERFTVLSMSPTSGSITITSGSVNVLGTSGMTAIPAAPAGDYPICAVRLFTGQTGIYETRVRNDLIDLRWNVFSSPATLHNNLGGIQGGIAGQYNHLTNAELAAVQAISGSSGGASNNDPFLTTGSSATLTNYRQLVAGTNITFDDTVANIRTISAVSGSGTSGSQVVPLNHPADAGFYLTGYFNTTGSFTSGSVTSGVSTLASLSDVSITGSQTDGQALVWSSGSSKWLPGTVASGSGGTTYSAVEYIDQTGGTGDTYGILSGSVNGSNKTFVTSQNKYYTGTLKVYRNGQLQTQGSGSSGDWSETASGSGMFDFYSAPITGDQLTAIYSITAAVSGSSGGASTLAGLTDVSISGSQTNGQSLVWSSGSSKWVSGAASLTNIYSEWDVNASPTSPSAYDKEFNSSGSSGNWAEYDPYNVLTLSFTDYGLKSVVTNTGNSNKLNGYVTPIPAGDFTIVTRIHMMEIYNTQVHSSGLIVSSGSAISDAAYTFWYENANTLNSIVAYRWTNGSTANGAALITTGVGTSDSTQMYLRLRRNGTTYYFDASRDGISWKQFWTNTIAISPTLMGLVNNVYGNLSRDSYHKFFRYFNSDVGLDAPLSGRLMNHY